MPAGEQVFLSGIIGSNIVTLTTAFSAQLDEDTARSTVQSYISSLKAQYPKLAAKLDAYYSHLDFETLLADAASTSDVKAYIYNETQSLLE